MVVSNILYFHRTPTYLLGEDFHFDKHIFQMGWFNHQLLVVYNTVNFKFEGPFGLQ